MPAGILISLSYPSHRLSPLQYCWLSMLTSFIPIPFTKCLPEKQLCLNIYWQGCLLVTQTRVTFSWLVTWLGTWPSWLRRVWSSHGQVALIPNAGCGSQPITHLHEMRPSSILENVWFKICRPSNNLNSKLVLLLIGRFPVDHANITNLCYVSHLWLISQ